MLRAGLVMASVAAACCLALVPVAAAAQSNMNAAEAAQLYTAAGFPVTSGQPVNRCGRPARPRVTFVDVNDDKRPEALFVDEDAACYAPSGRYFAVLTKEGQRWRAVIRGTGSIQAQATRTGGWMDMRVSEPGCVRGHRFDGRAYKPATGCSGESIAAAPQAAKPAPPQAPAQRPPAQPPGSAAPTKLDAADEAAAFKAAGFTRRGNAWRSHCDDPGTWTRPTRPPPSRRPGSPGAATRGAATATIRAPPATPQAASNEWPT